MMFYEVFLPASLRAVIARTRAPKLLSKPPPRLTVKRVLARCRRAAALREAMDALAEMPIGVEPRCAYSRALMQLHLSARAQFWFMMAGGDRAEAWHQVHGLRQHFNSQMMTSYRAGNCAVAALRYLEAGAGNGDN